MKATVIAGNPKPNSKTLDAAHRLVVAVTGRQADTEIDLAPLGAGLLTWGDAAVADAVKVASESDVVVFASPTFKASYSGLLKLFLDQFAAQEGLRGVVAIPLMLGAGPAHAMAPDLLLKPILTELGATTAVPGLYLIDSSYTTDDRIADYSQRWAPIVSAIATMNAGKR